MADLSAIVGGTSVEVETSLLPPIRMSGAELSGPSSGPGFLTRLLAPRVTVKQGSTVVFRVEPAGAPDPRLRLVALVVLALLGYVFYRGARAVLR